MVIVRHVMGGLALLAFGGTAVTSFSHSSSFASRSMSRVAAAPSWAELEAALPAVDAPAPALTLYRDTNGWCPFCERVWLALKIKNIPFDEKVINLRDKPDWYKEIVPTTLVPAVELHDSSWSPEQPGSGRLTWESADILKLLDEEFPDTVPLSHGSQAEAKMTALAEEVLSTGFAFSFGARNKTLSSEEVAGRRDAFAGALGSLEAAMEAHGGPFMAGSEPGLVDCMIIPMLERYRYQLPLLAKGASPPSLYDAAERPMLTRWYDAMDGLEPYVRRVAGDAYSWTAVTSTFLRLFSADGADPEDLAAADAAAEALLLSSSSSSSSSSSGPAIAEDAAALTEAARKVISNHEAIVGDACRPEPKSQAHVQRVSYTPQARAEVDQMLRSVAGAMLRQAAVSEKGSEGEAEPATAPSATAAAAARVIATRLCAPRDMGVPAAMALRSRLMEVAMAA